MPVLVKDALAGKHGEYEMVLTNPPFGKKSSVNIVKDLQVALAQFAEIAADLRNNRSNT